MMNETPAFCEVRVHKRVVLGGRPILHFKELFFFWTHTEKILLAFKTTKWYYDGPLDLPKISESDRSSDCLPI